MEVLKTISAVPPNEGRRLIRFAQTPSTCHDLEIRHKNGRGKKKKGTIPVSADISNISAGGDQIFVSTILDSSISC